MPADEMRDKLASYREGVEDLADARVDLKSRQSHRDRDRAGGDADKERRHKHKDKDRERRRDRDRDRDRDREERKLDKESRDHLHSRGRRRERGEDRRSITGSDRDRSDRDRESEDDPTDRRLLPNLQAQRMVDMAAMMGDGDGDDDTREFRRRVKDTIPQISHPLHGSEFKGRDTKPAAVMPMGAGVGPALFPTVKDLKLMTSPLAASTPSGGAAAAAGAGAGSGAGPGSSSGRHTRHSSHGMGPTYGSRPFYQPSGYSSKPPTHRASQFNSFGMPSYGKPPSRGMQNGMLQPPRTAHEMGAGLSLRGTNAALTPIPGSSGTGGGGGLFSSHFAGTGVKLL